MADAPAPAPVSLSRPLRSETPRQPAFRRDSVETIGETPGLKALARLVLARDNRRDTERDRVSRPSPQIEAFGKTVAGKTVLAAWGDDEEERAAIVEHDGGIPRAWAEGFARLDPARPPADVPRHRWLRFVDDVGLFLDGSFCAVATALGWGPYDLFGADRDRPYARIDQAGLVWLLNGDRLVTLSENTATIKSWSFARNLVHRTTFYRLASRLNSPLWSVVLHHAALDRVESAMPPRALSLYRRCGPGGRSRPERPRRG
jgi:hypothetical protein